MKLRIAKKITTQILTPRMGAYSKDQLMRAARRCNRVKNSTEIGWATLRNGAMYLKQEDFADLCSHLGMPGLALGVMMLDGKGG